MEPIIGSARITEKSDVISPPKSYLGVATSLLPGIKVLAESPDTPSIPLAFLSAHALECLLKAFLYSKIGSDECLKKANIRHNLLGLWQLAKQHDLGLPDNTPEWVNRLSSLHDSPFYLRYAPGVHGIVTPEVEPMVTELNDIFRVVDTAID